MASSKAPLGGLKGARCFRLSSATVVKPALFKGEVYIHFFNKKADRTITLTLGEAEELDRRIKRILGETQKMKAQHMKKCMEIEKIKAQELLAKCTDEEMTEEEEDDDETLIV
jgi:hypothetical protein